MLDAGVISCAHRLRILPTQNTAIHAGYAVFIQAEVAAMSEQRSQSLSAPRYEVAFVNNLSDECALQLMDIIAQRAQEQGISTQEYVRRWLCGDQLDQRRVP